MTLDATRYAEQVQQHGLSSTHRQTIAWVPEGARVLELGCASGFIGKILIDAKGCEVTGVEIDHAAAEQARRAGLTVLEGSLEDEAFAASIPGGYDMVLATDVLEHLREPATTLAWMERWLAPGGRAIVAVPNIATWSMRTQLLRGDFTYEDTGLLDRTHLRFFTWHTFHELVREPGWQIDGVMVDAWEVPLLQRALFDLPVRLRADLEPRVQADEAGLLGAARAQLYHAAGRAMRVHQGIGKRLGRRYPNLCAKHISLLLRPPPL